MIRTILARRALSESTELPTYCVKEESYCVIWCDTVLCTLACVLCCANVESLIRSAQIFRIVRFTSSVYSVVRLYTCSLGNCNVVLQPSCHFLSFPLLLSFLSLFSPGRYRCHYVLTLKHSLLATPKGGLHVSIWLCENIMHTKATYLQLLVL